MVYGDITIVKGYCRQVGNITDTTYNNILARADTELHSQLGLDVGETIDSGYVYFNKVKDLCELWSACRIHLMFGLPEDAEVYCGLYKEGIAQLIEDDTTLQDTNDVGTMEGQPYATAPLNPDGHRLTGRPTSGDGQSFF